MSDHSGPVAPSDSAASLPSLLEHPSNGSDDEVDSLPESETDSDSMTVSEDESNSDADREWKESMQQLELLLSLVIVPYMGKYFGRKFAYWGEFTKHRKGPYYLWDIPH